MMKSSNSETNQSLMVPKKLQRSISPSGRFCTSLSPSVRYNSPATSLMKTDSNSNSNVKKKKMMCMCAPTTHPGSFRCRFHKNVSSITKSNPSTSGSGGGSGSGNAVVSYHRLYARRSAMTNSLVRIGTVEGELMKRALAALIRPSSNQVKRRDEFKPKPSRLSVMTKAEDELVMV